jgi:Flp pilus assembly protein CpaB
VSALVAAGILAFAMSRYRQSVDANGKPETVLVANNIIEKGTAGTAVATQQLFSATRIVKRDVTTGAVSDVAALRGKVAATTIYPGQQLTASDFTVGRGVAASLAPNQRAVSVPLDGPHGLVGQVQPGDYVDVYAGWYGTHGANSGVGPGVLRLLIPDVLVLQSNPTTVGGVGSSNQGANVVLQVDDVHSGQLAYASDNAKLWLTLRPGNASAPPPSVISASQILAGTPTAPVAHPTR